MNPIMAKLLNQPTTLDRGGLVAEYILGDHIGNKQIQIDISGNGNDLQLGSTSGVDTNDPALQGAYADFSGVDDYIVQQNIASGSIAAGLALLSTADGQAFISGVNLSAYAAPSLANKPYMLVLKDSTSDVAWGYIGEVGAGETLGSELVANGDMEIDLNWESYNSPVVQERSSEQKHGGNYSRKISVDAQYEGVHNSWPVNYFTLNAGRVYKITCSIYGDGVNRLSVRLRDDVNNKNSFSPLSQSLTGYVYPQSWVTETWYYTGGINGSYDVEFISGTGIVSGVWYIDDVSIKEVLTPTTTGVKIYPTKTGTAQSMAGAAANFGANEALTWEVRKTDFQISGALTVGCWVKGAAQTEKRIFTKYASDNFRSWALGTGRTDNNTKAKIRISEAGTGISKDYESGFVVLNNTWEFVVFTFDSGLLRIFVNGKKDGAINKIIDNNLTAMYNSHFAILIGACFANTGLASDFFIGQIAHAFVYNRALSADEVYNAYRITRHKLRMRGIAI